MVVCSLYTRRFNISYDQIWRYIYFAFVNVSFSDNLHTISNTRSNRSETSARLAEGEQLVLADKTPHVCK